MTQYDAFEEKFAGALRSDAMPSGDFAARVMAQVAKTPQVKAGSSRRTWKIVLTAAACFAVVAVAVPVVFFGTMRAKSAAPESADCAAPAEAPAECEESTVENSTVNSFSVTADSAEAEYDIAANAIKEKSELPAEEVAVSDAELCAKVREVLPEMGLESDSGTYVLTAEQGEFLHEAMPELKLPAGEFVLILEG